jgi:hypothetical protein
MFGFSNKKLYESKYRILEENAKEFSYRMNIHRRGSCFYDRISNSYDSCLFVNCEIIFPNFDDDQMILGDSCGVKIIDEFASFEYN